MDNVEIIQLTEDRWEDYKDLRLKAIKSDPQSFGQTLEELLKRTDKEWKTLLTKTLDGRRRWVLFAEVDKNLVGMVSGTEMKLLDTGIKLQEMFVLKEFRGQGIATKLVGQLIREVIKATKRSVLRLGVFKEQVQALRFYKSLGFKIIEEKKETLPSGRIFDSLIMEKDLIKTS